MKFLSVLCVFWGLTVSMSALDREAFTFTNYDLEVRIEPEQQRLGARGKITLRNDSPSPQRHLVLQISSSLDWRSIQLEGKPVQFVSQPYASDIDHTGALTEAIVTLPKDVPPKGMLELEIGYEGVIPPDVTRLTRIGVPEDQARHSDWDQIGRTFTAVRGIGYVTWYPVATESASLSDGNSGEETVGRWKVRHADAAMSLLFRSTAEAPIFFSGTPDMFTVNTEDKIAKTAVFSMVRPGVAVPTFVIADYQKVAPKDQITVRYLPGREEAARAYGEAAAQIDPILPVGHGSESLQILGLPDAEAASFVSDGVLLCPLKSPITNEAILDIVYAKARHLVRSPRAWIQDGLAHYAQVRYIEQNAGREAALNYLQAHRELLVKSEAANVAGKAVDDTAGAKRSLINAPDDLYLQVKAMYVWWMLHDMLGGPLGTLLGYRVTDDKEPSYMQRVLEKGSSSRDLEWFFDDWVYRDRGLPDFRIESVYPHATMRNSYIVTVTVENLGDAGAEVPVTLKMDQGEVATRLEVRAKSKATTRLQAASMPLEVVVNDGSVPESNMDNNTYKIEVPAKAN
jgi:hypothetical protein